MHQSHGLAEVYSVGLTAQCPLERFGAQPEWNPEISRQHVACSNGYQTDAHLVLGLCHRLNHGSDCAVTAGDCDVLVSFGDYL